MIFNDNMFLASKILISSYNITYLAEAFVFHSHQFFLKDTFSRYFDLGVSQKQNEEIFRNISSENEGKKLLLCISKGLISEQKTHEIVYLFFQSLVKYCGYKCGLNYKKLPFFLIQKLSLNKDYWKRISNKL